MAPSLGATNFLAVGRVLGTGLGAAVAVAFYVRISLSLPS